MPQQIRRTWQIRRMTADQVDRIDEIDVSESGTVVYKWVDGRLTAVAEEWHRGNSYGDGWQSRAASIRAMLGEGGAAVGAFTGGRLVGFGALRYRLADEVAQLQALWVSAAYRRQGIATALTAELFRLASQNGATAVYVSGCPSESAVSFYRRQGFEPTPWLHRELYEREPEDIHMIKRL